MIKYNNNHNDVGRVVVGRGFCECRNSRYLYGRGFIDSIAGVVPSLINIGRIGKDAHSIATDVKDIRENKFAENAKKKQIDKLLNEIIGMGFRKI